MIFKLLLILYSSVLTSSLRNKHKKNTSFLQKDDIALEFQKGYRQFDQYKKYNEEQAEHANDNIAKFRGDVDRESVEKGIEELREEQIAEAETF